MVPLKLFFNTKCSLSVRSTYAIGHWKWFLNTNLFLIKPLLITKFDCTLIFSLKSLQVIFLLWAITHNFMKMDNLLTIMILTTVRLNGLMLRRNLILNLVNQLKSSIWTSLASIVSNKTQIRFQIVSTNIFQKSLVASYLGQQMKIKPLVMARKSFKNSKICLCPF